MGSVAGLRCLVSGGTSGVGLAVVRALLASGAAGVSFSGRRAALGAAEEAALGSKAHYICADLLGGSAVASALVAAATVACGGPPQVLVCAAGVFEVGSILEVSEEAWEASLAVNLTAAWHLTRAVLPAMIAARAGAIVHIASDWSLVGCRGAVAFAVSKAALVQLARCTALEHAADGVRVNALCLGETAVERAPDVRAPLAHTAAEDAHAAPTPAGRTINVEQAAAAVLFLADPSLPQMTGSCLVLDGGSTATGAARGP